MKNNTLFIKHKAFDLYIIIYDDKNGEVDRVDSFSYSEIQKDEDVIKLANEWFSNVSPDFTLENTNIVRVEEA